MKILTIDFETYYAKDYSLTKLTTEEYVRDSRFEVIGVAVKATDTSNYYHSPASGYSPASDSLWCTGSKKQIAKFLNQFDWANSIALAHNAMFDMAILNWHFDIRPKKIADTLAMSRAIHTIEVGGSLAALAEYYGLGAKGTEVHSAVGKKRLDFTPDQIEAYGGYCIQDVELTYKLFKVLKKDFPNFEMALIDLTLRMFTEPTITLETSILTEHIKKIKATKERLMSAIAHDRKELMSNAKFAELLEKLNVVVPRKISPTTGKETYAFAKTDEEFKKLLEHENEKVQALVAARLGVKSTIEETRTQRFIDIAGRGTLPIPLRYYAAHTGRWGGDDKINMQNLPRGSQLKKAMCAPEGYKFIDCDLSQIEARTLAWLAEADDLVEAFDRGDDVYKIMASAIYDKPEDEITKEERFVGKTTILGAGYGMGAVRFREQLKNFGTDIAEGEARRVINIYREANGDIYNLWKAAQNTLVYLVSGDALPFGCNNLLTVNLDKTALELPSGLLLRYEDLKGAEGEMGTEYTYQTRRGRTRIYGGKVIENVCQALARCIIGYQMLKVSKQYKVVLTVHDSIVCCVPDDEVERARNYIETCMRKVPDWAINLPIDCESGVGKSYGDCE